MYMIIQYIMVYYTHFRFIIFLLLFRVILMFDRLCVLGLCH